MLGMVTMKVKKDIEIMHLDDDDWCMSEEYMKRRLFMDLS